MELDDLVTKLKEQLADQEEEFENTMQQMQEEVSTVRREHQLCKGWKNTLAGNMLTDEELLVS